MKGAAKRNRQYRYLRALLETNGNRRKAACLAGIGESVPYVWARRDREFRAELLRLEEQLYLEYVVRRWEALWPRAQALVKSLDGKAPPVADMADVDFGHPAAAVGDWSPHLW